MQSHRMTVLRARVLCLAVTLIALFVLIRRIRIAALEEALRTMHPAWFVASACVYGLLFLPAALRWHLALNLTGSAVNVSTSVRLSLIGHFFYTIFFGAAGGDAAKSALYARLYRQPLPGILAASSLDRVLGFGGLLLFAAGAIAVGAAHGAVKDVRSMSLPRPWWWLVVGAVAVAVGIVVIARLPRLTFVRQFVDSFTRSCRKLVASPGKLAAGIGCGLAVQLALSGVLALNLQAVSHAPVPWLRLAWTFPVITALTALPISVAGLGMRESAAFVLFGLVNISQADAVAASLLTATAGLVWTVVGGLLLWRETIQDPAAGQAPPASLFDKIPPAAETVDNDAAKAEKARILPSES